MGYVPKLHDHGLTPELVAAQWTKSKVLEVIRRFLEFGPGLSEREVFVEAFRKYAPCQPRAYIDEEWFKFEATGLLPREVACWFMGAPEHLRVR